MNVRLLFADRSFDTSAPLPFGTKDLIFDLELESLFSAMAADDPVIDRAVRSALLHPLTDLDVILYRQRVLKDCLEHPAAVRQLYEITCEALKGRSQGDWWDSSDYAPGIFSTAVEMLTGYLDHLRHLREAADKNSRDFHSEGFTQLFTTLQEQLDNAFLKEAGKLLDDLQFRDGIVVGMRLGPDSRTQDYTLLRQNPQKFWLKWKLAPSYTPGPRDYNAIKDLNNRRDRAMTTSVNVMVGAAGHITDFLDALRSELAVYVGALNLHEKLQKKQVPLCIPVFPGTGKLQRSFRDLRDMSLALTVNDTIGNQMDTADKLLYIITGANQGGKTTFLRSLGQNQLMAQAGLFVAAEHYSCHICTGLFTHFRREEDDQMHSGKLDEELQRMDQIIPHLTPGSLVLFNESFASTNEREGSELCRQIAQALMEHNIETMFVTHLFAFANHYYNTHPDCAVFLRAQRCTDGSRTFELEEGKPLQTAFGQDLYRKIWGPNA